MGTFALFQSELSEERAASVVAAVERRAGRQAHVVRFDGLLLISSEGTELYHDRSSGLLLVADARFDEGMDGKEIVQSWRRDPDRFVDRVGGEFAMVLWDPATRRLAAARDRIGVRPLVYADVGGAVAFASEPSLLLAAGVGADIDYARIATYLVSLFEEEESTFHRAIRRLPPAHLLTIDGERRRMRRYWRLDEAARNEAETRDPVAAYRERFIAAVKRRFQPSGAGSLLSGGLDSSSIACVARQLGRDDAPLPVFSAIYPGIERSDERRYIDAVVAQGGMTLTTIDATELDPVASVLELIRETGEPFFAPNLFVHAALMDRARAAGVTGLLDGLDGDTSVSHGLGRMVELALRGRWVKLAREATLVAPMLGMSGRGEVVRRMVARPLVVRPLRRLLRRGADGDAPWSDDSAISGDLARELHLAEQYREATEERMRPRARQREDHLRRLAWPLHSFILEMLDRVASRRGIEPLYPFYDPDLLALSVALPSEQKLDGGWTRLVLRRAMEGILPPEVQWRRDKSDLGGGFAAGMVRGTDLLGDLVAASDPALVDLPRLREIHERLRRGEASEGEMLALWKGVTVTAWMGGR